MVDAQPPARLLPERLGLKVDELDKPRGAIYSSAAEQNLSGFVRVGPGGQGFLGRGLQFSRLACFAMNRSPRLPVGSIPSLDF
jgi:hypothetical protein